ncbi:uncharacterized protein TNIN_280901 [Trichonephila inaurata madagascariensis]|uniref:Uncharacterized protein n=1 Tax=Trichonephila inaurata madagascariensis TaxID=2747483 RepID=A0A8X6J9G9_9ARAC|nr:uncharacterized protein TNIN_280901 [Trichonephila inaurata madagascariensis]
MANDPIFRHLAKEVFSIPNVEILNLNLDNNEYSKSEIALIKNLLDVFPKVFAVLEISIKRNWTPYIDTYIKELMLQTPELYVGVMLTFCCKENEGAVDIYDRFLNVFALVNYITNMVFTTTGANFYELSSQILTVFYENVLRQDFDERGGWKCLKKYIQDKKFVKYFNDCDKHNFVTDDFPKKLKLKIRDSFSFQSPSIPRTYEMEAEFVSMVDDLKSKVMSSAKISPLNDPKLKEDLSISKEAERSNSSKANILEVSGTMVSDESDLYARCKSKVEELEYRLQDLVVIFQLLDEE